MTRAVVLAAGRGTRLGRHTRHLPKACVRAGGRSLLAWNLDALAACGIGAITIVGGYRHECLVAGHAELVVAEDWSTQGPLHSLLAARPHRFDEPFLVVYADCAHHPDNLRALLAATADIAVAGDRAWESLWRERHGDPLIDAETYRAHAGWLQVIGTSARGLDEVEAQFAGLVRFTAQGWRRSARVMERASCTDMTSLLAALVATGQRIADVAIDGRWCEIDSAGDLALCRRRLHAGDRWHHDWRPDERRRACP